MNFCIVCSHATYIHVILIDQLNKRNKNKYMEVFGRHFSFRCVSSTTSLGGIWTGAGKWKQPNKESVNPLYYQFCKRRCLFWLDSHPKFPSQEFTWECREITSVMLAAVEPLFHADLIWLLHFPLLMGAQTMKVNSPRFESAAPNKV